MNRHSLRFRISVWHTSLLAGSLTLYGILTYSIVQHYLIKGLNDSIEYHARTIAEKVLVNLDRRGQQYLEDELNERYVAEIYPRFIRVTRSDGTLIFQTAAIGDPHITPSSIPIPSGPFTQAYLRTILLDDGHHLQIYTLPYRAPDGKSYVIESGRTFDAAEHVLHRLALALLLGLPAIATLSLSGGIFFLRSALKPLEDIEEYAECVSLNGKCEPIPVPNTADEIGRLATSLNRMIARLDESYQRANRFSGDVSHELRTPLTVLRGELEAAVQRGSLTDLLDSLGSALEETERLQTIVSNLLEISRLDEEKILREKVSIDLGNLARCTAEQMRLLAEVKSVELRYVITEGIEVEGDPIYLKQAVVNLLDNAIKYAPAGGWVEIRVLEVQSGAILEVVDNGPGISSESLPFLFDRFYRADKARSRETGGVGLGLSIVKAICSAHSAKISVSAEKPHGARFHIEMPLRNAKRALLKSVNL
jgi:signal transduction histidine kinase